MPSLLALLVALALSSRVIRDDLRHAEIPAVPVLGLAAALVLLGALAPLPGLEAGHALAGAALGLGVATLTRGYIHLRTGWPGFGGADIALIGGAGGLLGPFALGPWILVIVAAGLACFAVAGLARRAPEGDGEERIIPFCPAILLCAWIFYGLGQMGLLPLP